MRIRARREAGAGPAEAAATNEKEVVLETDRVALVSRKEKDWVEEVAPGPAGAVRTENPVVKPSMGPGIDAGPWNGPWVLSI